MMDMRKLLCCLAFLCFTILPARPDGTEGRPSLYDMAAEQLSQDAAAGSPVKKQDRKGATDRRDGNGATPLMLAAKDGNDWAVRTLLESGAEVDARDDEGWTALMYAVRYQSGIGTVSILCGNGASLRVRGNHNETPLLLAAAYSRNPDIISILLADRSGAEEEVFNAFILAIGDDASDPAIKEAKLDVFIRKGVPVNGFFRGLTPLMYACRYGSSSWAAACLLKAGADASARGDDGKRAADYAMENPLFPHDRVFSVLLEGNGL